MTAIVCALSAWKLVTIISHSATEIDLLSLSFTQFPVDYRWITSSVSLTHAHLATNTAVAMRHLYKYLLVFNRFHPTFRILVNNKKLSCGVLKTKDDNSEIFLILLEILIIKKRSFLASHMTLVIRLTINGDWYSHSENKKTWNDKRIDREIYFHFLLRYASMHFINHQLIDLWGIVEWWWCAAIECVRTINRSYNFYFCRSRLLFTHISSLSLSLRDIIFKRRERCNKNSFNASM